VIWICLGWPLRDESQRPRHKAVVMRQRIEAIVMQHHRETMNRLLDGNVMAAIRQGEQPGQRRGRWRGSEKISQHQEPSANKTEGRQLTPEH